MDITTVLVSLVIAFYVYRWYKRPKQFPPGPRGIPLVGVLPFMGKYPERKLNKWAKSYGPIFSVRFGSNDHVVLNNYTLINQALVKQSAKFSGRPWISYLHEMSEGHGLVFVDHGNFWKSQRKFGSMTLRGFGVGKKSMEIKIIEELGYLNDSIRNENGKAFDVSTLLHNAVANNICSVILGRRFDYDDPRFTETMHKVLRQLDDPIANAMSFILSFVPQLINIPPFSIYYKAAISDIKDVLKLLYEKVNDHSETFDEKNLRDFIDVFLLEMRSNKDTSFSNLQLVQYIRDLLFAGTETTASTLYWCLLCLLHYPQTQTKIRQEVMEVVGAHTNVSLSNKGEMPYTNAFIQEIFRYRTLLPLSVFHMTSEVADIGGYSIPKGTTILPNLWAVHNDPELFKEPEKFKPERFLDEKGNYLPSNHVIPFSVGPRHCLGEQLARMEIFIFLVGMIQKFEFLPDPSASSLPNIEDGSNGTAFVPTPYKLIAKEH